MAKPFYFWQTVSKRPNGNPDISAIFALIYFNLSPTRRRYFSLSLLYAWSLWLYFLAKKLLKILVNLTLVGGLAILKRSALSIKPLRLSLKQMNSTRKTYLRELTETTMEFPNLEDWSGTVRGLFMLYDTYEFNITEAARGNIVFQVGWHFFPMWRHHWW